MSQVINQVWLMLDVMAAQASVELFIHDCQISTRRNEINIDGAVRVHAEDGRTLQQRSPIHYIEILDVPSSQNRVNEGADLQNGMTGKQIDRSPPEHLWELDHLRASNPSQAPASTQRKMQWWFSLSGYPLANTQIGVAESRYLPRLLAGKCCQQYRRTT
jgi:hypothetical protein